MPTYDYECQNCHHTFEMKQSFASESVADCPVCQNEARRVFHSVPVVFKGSGFYVTDYGRGSGSAGSRSDGPKPESESKSKSSSDPGSEAKSGKKSASTS